MPDLKLILDFLKQLQLNNNTSWMHENKSFFHEAQENFIEIVHQLLIRLAETEPNLLYFEPKKLIFRINRDIRFSKDKTPYNTSFRAHIGPNGKDFIPVGYYFQLAPDFTFLGGGIYSTNSKESTTKIRNHILKNGKELEKILNEEKFKKNFELKGEQLKNVPQGYDKENPFAEFLKNKSFYLQYNIEEKYLADYENLLNISVEKFLLMKKFNNFINTALK